MSIGALVFARMGSRRLPGKALMQIGPWPLLGYVLDRTRLIGGVDGIVVATSDHPDDEAIVEFARREGFASFRGSLEDVGARALGCARAFGFDGFVRICGDRPLFDPVLTTRCLRLYKEGGWDLVTNAFPATYGPGLTVEVISATALDRCLRMDLSAEDREHVTPYFYKHPDEFTIRNVAAETDCRTGVKLTVDDESDLARIHWILSRLKMPAARAPIAAVIALSREWEAGAHAGKARDD